MPVRGTASGVIPKFYPNRQHRYRSPVSKHWQSCPEAVFRGLYIETLFFHLESPDFYDQALLQSIVIQQWMTSVVSTL